MLIKGMSDRNPGRNQLPLRQTVAGKFGNQGLMRNKKSIGVDLIHTGTACIIGSYKICFKIREIFFSDLRQNHGSKYMRADNDIVSCLHQIIMEAFRILSDNVVNHGAISGFGRMIFDKFIPRAKKPGDSFVYKHMSPADKIGFRLRIESQSILDFTEYADGFKIFLNCRRCRIMSAAGIT